MAPRWPRLQSSRDLGVGEGAGNRPQPLPSAVGAAEPEVRLRWGGQEGRGQLGLGGETGAWAAGRGREGPTERKEKLGEQGREKVRRGIRERRKQRSWRATERKRKRL